MRLLALLVAVALGGCALEDEPAGPPEKVCIPGDQKACLTDADELGAHECNAAGSAWSECAVPVTPIGGCTNDEIRQDGTSPDCMTPEAPYCREGACLCFDDQPCAQL